MKFNLIMIVAKDDLKKRLKFLEDKKDSVWTRLQTKWIINKWMDDWGF